MTRFRFPDGKLYIKWDEGDPVDWTTPGSEWHGHSFCGNCGLDDDGCGCPRDENYEGDASALAVQNRDDEPIPVPFQPPGGIL